MDSSGHYPNDLVEPTPVDSAGSALTRCLRPVTRRVTLPRAKHVRLHGAGEGGKRILFVASEVHPFSRTGGLADVAGSLPKALADTGYEVAVATPYYRRLFPRELRSGRLAEFEPGRRPIDRPWSLHRALLDNRVPVYMPAQAELFDRDHLYGNGAGDYPDNPERFAFFVTAVLESLKTIGWRPDVIHCNDWQTGLLPLYLRDMAKQDRFFDGIRTVFTVHNMAFAGLCRPEKLPALGIGPEHMSSDRLEFYGGVSLLKSGLVFADRVTTVSPTYCREIQGPEQGCGLDGVLRTRQGALNGILNGIDYDVWNPATDPALVAAFGASHPAGKELNKHALQVVEDLEVSAMPLASIVSRLTDQKGLDLVAEAAERLLSLPMQLVVMGEGEKKYIDLLARVQARFPDRMRVHPWFELDEAKRIYAASDIYLMPSRFEPCGLSELIGMRYGAVPVVRRTGGLADAVKEFDPVAGTGNGFMFDEYSADSLVGAAQRAAMVYRDPEAWTKVRRNGMNEDFSWRRSVRDYKSLYDSLLA